jgi:hypothetical protein
VLAPCRGTLRARLSRASLRRSQYTLSKTKLKKRHNIVDERQALYEEVRVLRVPRACKPWR